MTRPAVIRLIVYAKIPHGARRRVTRAAILARDRWTCQYCGGSNHLTVDHVVPRSKGGEHSWANCVACCVPCNQRKGHTTPQAAGMKLRRKPRAPDRGVFIYIAVKSPPLSWQEYLAS